MKYYSTFWKFLPISNTAETPNLGKKRNLYDQKLTAKICPIPLMIFQKI